MNYLELTNETDGSTFIVITNEDGSAKSFPADPANPEYVAFLESLNDNTETE